MAKIILVGLVLLFAFLWATGLLSRKPEEQVKSRNSSNIKEVEVLIIELKAKILAVQSEADKGIKEAEENLARYKKELETALELKEKYNK